MIVGNKCDMADKRQVARHKGEEVGCLSVCLSVCHCSVILSTLHSTIALVYSSTLL